MNHKNLTIDRLDSLTFIGLHGEIASFEAHDEKKKVICYIDIPLVDIKPEMITILRQIQTLADNMQDLKLYSSAIFTMHWYYCAIIKQ